MRKIEVLIGIIGVRVLILLITLLTLAGIYILYRRVFLPRSRSKSIDALIPTLECIGAFDEQVVTANRATVTLQGEPAIRPTLHRGRLHGGF